MRNQLEELTANLQGPPGKTEKVKILFTLYIFEFKDLLESVNEDSKDHLVPKGLRGREVEQVSKEFKDFLVLEVGRLVIDEDNIKHFFFQYKGPQGEPGYQGEHGEKGDKGDQGEVSSVYLVSCFFCS